MSKIMNNKKHGVKISNFQHKSLLSPENYKNIPIHIQNHHVPNEMQAAPVVTLNMLRN